MDNIEKKDENNVNLNTRELIIAENNAFYQILPDSLKKHYIHSVAKYSGYSTDELHAMIRPTKIQRAYKLAFWNHVNKSMANGTKVILKDSCVGICTIYWVSKMITNELFSAWLLREPLTDQTTMLALYDQSLENFEKIITMSLYDPKTGEVDPKRATLFLTAHKMLEDRVKGSVISRVESKNLTVRVDEKTDSREDRIEALKKKLEIAMTPTIHVINEETGS